VFVESGAEVKRATDVLQAVSRRRGTRRVETNTAKLGVPQAVRALSPDRVSEGSRHRLREG